MLHFQSSFSYYTFSFHESIFSHLAQIEAYVGKWIESEYRNVNRICVASFFVDVN